MNKQQIIDAIDAEIEAKREAAKKTRSHESTNEGVLIHLAYVNGLRFAKQLIEKAKEVGS